MLRDAQILASCPLTPLSLLFKDGLSRLWLTWELLVTSEPIVIYAPGDPATASEIVTWLVTLIRPLTFGGDWRPLFTLQQSDYGALVGSTKPASGVILGITSPLVFNACRSFQHVIRATPAIADSPTPVFKGGQAKHESTSSYREAQEATTQGLFSTSKRVVHRDSSVLKAAEAAMRTGDCAFPPLSLFRAGVEASHRPLCRCHSHTTLYRLDRTLTRTAESLFCYDSAAEQVPVAFSLLRNFRLISRVVPASHEQIDHQPSIVPPS